jgi:hypothetical protein
MCRAGMPSVSNPGATLSVARAWPVRERSQVTCVCAHDVCVHRAVRAWVLAARWPSGRCVTCVGARV